MIRILLASMFSLASIHMANGQCGQWYPPSPIVIYVPGYSVSPQPRTAPAVPKKVVVKAAAESKVPPIEGLKKETEPNDAPKIPKLKLPLPDDPDFKPVPVPKKEPGADDPKAVEEFVVPADEKSSNPGPQVRVGFFNHSEREIVLEVNGEQLKIPSSQFVTLRLPRTFAWAEKGRKAKDVVVPPDADGIEIVFRK
ncbi:MAG: hypothetical protein EXS09_08985 [Gemmataceae bacterium]|nr:hypothetical protein [Gemmataceae bacterium]